jgi:lipopolysaccharide export system protein LptA
MPFVLLCPLPALAQGLDLSRGGPINITAQDGIEWRQQEQQVIARGDARATRENVTITADRLVAWYRKKGTAGAPKPAAPTQAAIGGEADSGDNEIYRVQAEGRVHIFTPTDQAWGDRATYDMDQAVLVMTGRNLKLTTPNEVLTARDTLEYWSQKHMAVARGNAVMVTNDAKRLAADTLVAYTTDSGQNGGKPAAAPHGGQGDAALAAGKLDKVEAFGNVSVRTQTDIVTGDRGVYVPETGIARLGGNVRITRGSNQLNGSQADVNMKTGIAVLTGGATGGGGSSRVQGLVVPNDPSNKQAVEDPFAAGRGGSRQPGAKPAAKP